MSAHWCSGNTRSNSKGINSLSECVDYAAATEEEVVVPDMHTRKKMMFEQVREMNMAHLVLSEFIVPPTDHCRPTDLWLCLGA